MGVLASRVRQCEHIGGVKGVSDIYPPDQAEHRKTVFRLVKSDIRGASSLSGEPDQFSRGVQANQGAGRRCFGTRPARIFSSRPHRVQCTIPAPTGSFWFDDGHHGRVTPCQPNVPPPSRRPTCHRGSPR